MDDQILNKYEQAAKKLLELEKTKRVAFKPEPAGVLVVWHGHTYIGSILVISPEFSDEIVALNKSTTAIPTEFEIAIRKLDPGRICLAADDSLDLTGRLHLLRRVENRLTIMTPDQTVYMLHNLSSIQEN